MLAVAREASEDTFLYLHVIRCEGDYNSRLAIAPDPFLSLRAPLAPFFPSQLRPRHHSPLPISFIYIPQLFHIKV
jgi:hypothetical protein